MAAEETPKDQKEELAKAYEPQAVEDGIYARWEASGLFNPDNLPPRSSEGRAESFTVIMPPPNATGTLHVGHAMFMTLQDLMTRFHRMRGKAALWLPGTDHAALATNAKVEKIIAKEGKTKEDLGREAFVKRVEEFVEGSQGTIRKQIRKMGSSCDWSREAYTLDEPRSRVVREVFKRMYDDGLIYRGDRIVNWCPGCQSAVADDEVVYKEGRAKMYYMKYGPFTVATTRPETKLGDTAVAVHPEDARYKKMIGTTFTVDFGSGPLEIKVIGDEGVDPNFGSGALGVTPAHSAVDFAMAEKNDLPIKKVIGEDGKMTALAGAYAGMPVLEARAKLVADLEAKGLIEKVEEITHNLSLCERSSDPIEPLTSRQWFVGVNREVPGRGKTLKQLSIDAVRDGGIQFVPDRFAKTYFHWMENLHDWCISRQIWFGHRIPVWYCATCVDTATQGVIVATEAPTACPTCGTTELAQDPDMLDTWFSSGTWTFSTLGWPEDAKGDLRRFHPTDVLETGYDIIFFWVARMILMTEYAVGAVPFKTVYLHGLVRDEQGRKMSKSLENIIDPIDVSEKYGTDAVRLSLVIGNTAGNDMRISEEKIAYYRNFTNKLWNISRFVRMSAPALARPQGRPEPKTAADRWILSRLDAAIASVTADIEAYAFSRPGETLRDFTWNDLADWYLEIAKIEGGKDEMLSFLLDATLKLWHPFMPFVTEEVYGGTFAKGADDFLMVAEWPATSGVVASADAGFDALRETVVAIRNIRATHGIPPGKRISVTLHSTAHADAFAANSEVLKGLAKADELTIAADGVKPENAASAIIDGVQIHVSLEGLVDPAAEKARIEKELAEALKYADVQEKKLSNQDFVSRAPEQVIAGERQKLADAKDRAAKLQAQLDAMK